MNSLAAIIITVYNKENYFDACLQSVLTQKCSYPFVVILSDDCSTDSSASLCRTYAERYSNVEDITDGEHRGVVGNYLYCLKHALDLGVKYISQVDCDDILADENFLFRQISFLEKNEEAQVATSSFFLINEKENLASARAKFNEFNPSLLAGYKELNISTKSLLIKNNPIVAGGATYRTQYLKKYLEEFATTEDSTQDLPLWLFLSQYGKFYGCGVKSLAYRDLQESVSRSADIEKQIDFQGSSLLTRLRFIDKFQLKRYTKGAKRLFLLKVLRHTAKLDKGKYLKKLWATLKEDPSVIFYGSFWRSILVYLKKS
ncbi:MAG: glycosyltransferase family 2 protein [Bacteroidales bacterium]|nr:glycosyltransferase family 2 protein [Bacteroidales bacterium]